MKKKNTFFIVHILVFLIIFFYFTPRLLSFLVISPNFLSSLGIILFAFIFNLFFYYIVYNVLSIIFSQFNRNEYSDKSKSIKLKNYPSVALLYLTKDDFNENACKLCLNQDYENFKVFILDDSISEESISKIDNFSIIHKDKVQVIRRTDKSGFKAGNINHGLRLIHSDYQYFAVSDSDGSLPANFITDLLKYFHLDDSIGFVQAYCYSNSEQQGLFAKDMSSQVDIHWKHFVPFHNSYGFVMFYGHSALIKTSVWKEIKGFPEFVSEDLWFSYVCKLRGYQGIYANNVITYEDIPENYSRFRSRHEKWVRGTTEFLKYNWFSILVNKKLLFIEKVDLLSSNFTMLMSAPFIFFILLIAFVLPYHFHAFKLAGATFSLPVASVGKQASDYLIGFRYNMYWSWDFFLIVVTGILYPVIPAFIELWKQPFRLINYVLVSTGIYTSLTISSTLSIFSYLISGKISFPVTGGKSSDSIIQDKIRLFNFDSCSLVVIFLEFITGLILIVTSFQSHNFWFLPLAYCLIFIPIIIKINYKFIKGIIYIPFIIQFLLLILIFKNIVS